MKKNVKLCFAMIAALSASLTAHAQQSSPAANTSHVVKPIPKELLKDLHITFDDNGKPIFTIKNNVKAIQCKNSSSKNKPATAQLPDCASLRKQGSTAETVKPNTAKAMANTAADPVCYTIEWENDGVIYTYTVCFDNAGQ